VKCSQYCKRCLPVQFKAGPCQKSCSDCGNEMSYSLPTLSFKKLFFISYCFLSLINHTTFYQPKEMIGTLRIFQHVSSARWQLWYHESEICFYLLFNNKYHKNAINRIQYGQRNIYAVLKTLELK